MVRWEGVLATLPRGSARPEFIITESLQRFIPLVATIGRFRP